MRHTNASRHTHLHTCKHPISKSSTIWHRARDRYIFFFSKSFYILYFCFFLAIFLFVSFHCFTSLNSFFRVSVLFLLSLFDSNTQICIRVCLNLLRAHFSFPFSNNSHIKMCDRESERKKSLYWHLLLLYVFWFCRCFDTICLPTKTN